MALAHAYEAHQGLPRRRSALARGLRIAEEDHGGDANLHLRRRVPCPTLRTLRGRPLAATLSALTRLAGTAGARSPCWCARPCDAAPWQSSRGRDRHRDPGCCRCHQAVAEHRLPRAIVIAAVRARHPFIDDLCGDRRRIAIGMHRDSRQPGKVEQKLDRDGTRPPWRQRIMAFAQRLSGNVRRDEVSVRPRTAHGPVSRHPLPRGQGARWRNHRSCWLSHWTALAMPQCRAAQRTR